MAEKTKTLSALEMIAIGIEGRQNNLLYSFANEMVADGVVKLFTDKEFLKALKPIADDPMPGTDGTIFEELKKIKIKCKCPKQPCENETKTDANGITWIKGPATNCIWVIFPIDQIITESPD